MYNATFYIFLILLFKFSTPEKLTFLGRWSGWMVVVSFLVFCLIYPQTWSYRSKQPGNTNSCRPRNEKRKSEKTNKQKLQQKSALSSRRTRKGAA